jgi:hypothetical protein
MVFALFSTQLLFTDPQFRFYYSCLYVVLAVGLILLKKDVRNGLYSLFSASGAAPEAVEKN